MHVAIWDLDDTLYHRHVQVGDDYSGTHDIVLFPDALPALTKPDQIDILVTKESREGVQGVKLDALGIRERFEEIHTVRRDEDKREVFASIRERFALPIYVIGDRVDSEILYGNELGMMTILCPRGKYLFRKPGSEVERPDYTIRDLTELGDVVHRSVEIVFETHGTTVDNEAGVASGWNDAKLSKRGIREARELGARRADEHFDTVFCSDLSRSYATAEIAFGDRVPIIRDERLRECDYGKLNGQPGAVVKPQNVEHITKPFPGGESYLQTTARMKRFLDELLHSYNHRRVMVIGHRATQYALEHLTRNVPLEEAVAAAWEWQPGWTYRLKALD